MSIRRRSASLTLSLLAGCLAAPPDSAEPPAQTAQAVVTRWDVPYLRQRDYPNIGESACAPTSVTMLLRYYFPGIATDMPEVFHAGTQAYGYSGPLSGYQNISAQAPNTGLAAVPPAYRGYYSGAGYTGAVAASLESYLRNVWGLDARFVDRNDEAALYEAVSSGPVLVRVFAHGNADWGHWMVVVGIDDRDTASHADDTILAHDPYGSWNSSWDTSSGNARPIGHREFFVSGRFGSPWLRGLIVTARPSNPATHVADNGSPGAVALNADDWREYYGAAGALHGDWVYPRSGARFFVWPSVVRSAGWYDITANVIGDDTSGSVTYAVQRCAGGGCAWRGVARVVDQHRATREWVHARVGRAYLAPGDQVYAVVPANTNVDSIRFEAAAAPTCAYRCADYRYYTAACGGGWSCFEDGCLGYTGAPCGSCQYACSRYGYREGQCWGGWRCNAGCLAWYGPSC